MFRIQRNLPIWYQPEALIHTVQHVSPSQRLGLSLGTEATELQQQLIIIDI
jgi:hypothetical protein